MWGTEDVGARGVGDQETVVVDERSTCNAEVNRAVLNEGTTAGVTTLSAAVAVIEAVTTVAVPEDTAAGQSQEDDRC